MDQNWDDLRFFLAVAQSGSLTAAARRLRVSQPTVSRRLAAMEQSFGAKLFDRTRSGYELSLAGLEIYESAQHVAIDVDEIWRKVFGQDQRITGTVRLTCTEVMANLYLAPHLSQFAEQHPEIDMSVVCTFQNLSLSRREADIAVRVTSQPPDNLIGRRLATTAVGVYASAERAAEFDDPSQAASWDWIGWQDDSYNRLLISASYPEARIRHRVDDMQAMRAMTRNGIGVAALPCYMADIDEGLRRVVSDLSPRNDLDLWILYHPDVRRVSRVRLFADFLTEAILADRDLFEGRRPWSR